MKSTIFSWNPPLDQIIKIKSYYLSKVFENLLEIIVSNKIDTDKSEILIDKLTKIKDKPSVLTYLYYQIKNASNNEKKKLCETILNYHPKTYKDHYTFSVHSFGKDIKDTNLSIGKLENPIYDRLLSDQYTDVIQQIWPDIFKEIKSIVSEVIPFKSEKLRSSSHSFLASTVFINEKFLQQPNIVYYDLLIHECSHQVLELIQLLDHLTLNPEELTYSPLREEPRTINGVLHSVFVIKRLYNFFSLFDEEIDFDLQEIKVDYKSRLKLGIEELASKAKWTDNGKILFSSLRDSF